RIHAFAEQGYAGLMAQRIELVGERTEPVSEGAEGAGGSGGSESPQPARLLKGNVRSVDTYAQTLLIDLEPEGDAETVRATVLVYYDFDTQIRIEGLRMRPEDVHPRDPVEVQVWDLGTRYLAQRISVSSAHR
ncbi:MAG TPA: hypothetical protein VMM92_05500, partial [Thermoanaerobaculia bacterium]|nr:hypothetical protein [Thermoanaerobaculia bacterium]